LDIADRLGDLALGTVPDVVTKVAVTSEEHDQVISVLAL